MWSQSLYPSQDFSEWSTVKNSDIYFSIKEYDLLLAKGNLRDT